MLQYRSDFTESNQPKKIMKREQSPKKEKIQIKSSKDKNSYLKNEGIKFNEAVSHSFRSKNVREKQVAAEDAKAKRIA